ncbi:Uncharacterized protein TCM_035539 [Theobroma cacao]|uniref:Uncharacterized protein n=1 Tax=Theobroma cacao TaxID=3641 RepID=A0A061FQC2_THECC|nr:Uncharacterized protein TCM_035539 [Theobroma cacao]
MATVVYLSIVTLSFLSLVPILLVPLCVEASPPLTSLISNPHEAAIPAKPLQPPFLLHGLHFIFTPLFIVDGDLSTQRKIKRIKTICIHC